MQVNPSVFAIAALLVSAAHPASAAVPPAPAPIAGAPVLSTLPTAPTFAGLRLTRATIDRIVTAAREPASSQLLSWGRCEQALSSGAIGYLDHCATISVGNASAIRTYVVLDTPCPAHTTTACYGGYVVSARLDTDVDDSLVGGVNRVVMTSQLRLGYKFPLAALGGGMTTAYVLPATAALTIVVDMVYGGTGRPVPAVTATDASGAVIFSGDLPSPIALWGGSFTCADAGELAAGAVGLMGIGTASGVAAGIAMGGTLVGLEVAAAGTGLSLGSLTLPAGLAGAGIAGTSYAAAGLAFTILSAQALANATVTNVVVREACEFAEALAEFDPEDINDRDEPVQEDSGANDSSIPSGDTGGACDQTYEPIDVEIDGATCTVSCRDLLTSSGECKLGCVVVCD